MIIASQLVDLACRIGGPRFAHRVYLRRLERWHNYEPEYYLLDHLVDPARAAIDVGANEGIYTGRLSQLSSRVHCFEPIPHFADALHRKLDISVSIHQCALSNRKGEAELRIPFCDETEMHGTSTLEEQNPLPGSTHVKRISCALERLDDMVSEPVGFIKIDVEGHEAAVLEGAGRILREDKPTLLIESEQRHNASAPQNVFQHFAAFGYTGLFLRNRQLCGLSSFRQDVDQRPENALQPGRPYINNFIFLPSR